MSESTPRTDEKCAEQHLIYHVGANFARTLERELNAVTASLRALADAYEKANERIVAQQVRIERLKTWVAHRRIASRDMDHGCSCCCPESELIVEGFRCVYHETDDLSALHAYKRQAQVEVLKEAERRISEVDDDEQPAYPHCKEVIEQIAKRVKEGG